MFQLRFPDQEHSFLWKRIILHRNMSVAGRLDSSSPTDQLNIDLPKKMSQGASFHQNGKNLTSYMGVSKNNGTPKSSVLIGFSIINHPFWGTSIFGNTHMLPSLKLT